MRKLNKIMLVLFLSLILLISLCLVSALPTPKKINNNFIRSLNSLQSEDIKSDIQLILPQNPNKIVDDLNEYLDLDLTENKKKDISKKLKKDIYTKYSVIDDTNQFLLDLENTTDIKLEEKDIEKIKEKLKELKKTPLINDAIGEREDSTLIAKSSAEVRSESSSDETAPFLGGSTAVIIIFVNQPGEDWEADWDSHISYALGEVGSATDWMISQAPSGSSLSFKQGYYVADLSYDIEGVSGWTWTEDATADLGFTDSDSDGKVTDEMLNYVKSYFGTDNAVAVFIPHVDGRSYAYVYGPPRTVVYFYDYCFIFCTKETYPTYAHEMLHLFGADDEYYQEHDGTGCGANSCWEPVPFSYEPLQALYTNGNCERCNPNSVDCIMKDHNIIKSNPSAIEYYTKGQIGWWDYDGDSVVDPFDNCIINSNPSQTDTDGDGFGDDCDIDYDGDGILNANDNCPFAYNPLQENNDVDSQGDACDSDDDNDDVEDSFDECPFIPGIDYYAGCPDTFAPSVYSSSVSLGDNQPGGIITITTYVYDPSGVNYVLTEIENPDENVITTLNLYDDGSHGDEDPEDGIYTNTWTTADEGTYLVDFLTGDNALNSETFDNVLRFSTETFTSSSRILLIYDDLTDFYTYYQDALTSNNFPFDYYNTYEKGNPYSSLFYNYDLIIWATGNDWTQTLTEDDQINLQDYLDNSGTLFISGQDIGYNIRDSDFYSNYLHAQYVQDDSNLLNLEGVNSDPISGGLALTIAGEGGADNQWYPSEIDPINNAQSIFMYSPVVVASPLLSEKNPSNQKEEYGVRFGKLDKDVSETSGIISSGTGALRFENEIYKLVYFAFGFEGINNESTRTELMGGVVNWLIDLIPPEITIISPLNNSWHNSSTVFIDIDGGETAKWIEVFLDSESPAILCNDCATKSYDLTNLDEGLHTFTVYSSDYSDNVASKTIEFYVDTIEPIINDVVFSAVDGHVSTGLTYTLDYSELNPDYIHLLCYYDSSNISDDYSYTDDVLESGDNKIWEHTIDLSKRSDESTVDYCQISIYDNVGNSNVWVDVNDYVIDKCTPNLVQINESCSTDDTFVSWFNDTNKCFEQTGTESDQVPSNEINSCDYCIPDWQEMNTNCGIDDTSTTYFTDTNTCYEQTSLSSDLEGKPENITSECDYCLPSWTEVLGECQSDESLIGLFNDTNKCFEQTNLDSDMEGKPEDIIYLLSCDYDGNGFIGNVNNINTTLTDLNLNEEEGIIYFKEGNETIIECGMNLSNKPLNLDDLFIERESNESTFSYMLIGGLDLTSQNQTKTIYLNRILNGTGVCVKDEELTSITEISGSCNGEGEVWISCPGSNADYVCELVNNDTQYKISGLRHSGIKEQEVYCGDGIPNGDETCSSCPADVGACPTNDGGGSSGGGGGGGGGGGSSTKTTKTQTINQTTVASNQTESTPEGTEEGQEETPPQEQEGGRFAPITGAAIGTAIKENLVVSIIFIVAVVGGVVGLGIWRRKKKRKIR